MFRFAIYVDGVLKPPVYSEIFVESDFFRVRDEVMNKYPNKIINLNRI